MIQAIHHVQITVAAADEAAARDFYVHVLGLRPVAKPDSLQGRGGFWVEVGDQQLHVGVEEGVARARTKGHVAYQVDDLAAWRAPTPGSARCGRRAPFGTRREFTRALQGDEPPPRRFTSRADNYARYRPTYPAAALDWLWSAAGLSAGRAVADVGSGTGILTALLLARGATVYAVEPNAAMRAAAEAALGHHPGFVSVDATAEATTLPDASVELITAGQAFHWFEAEAARAEFGRILRPGGAVALIWNSRDKGAGGFGPAYEALLTAFAPSYGGVPHGSRMDKIARLFAGGYEMRVFDHERPLDYDSLLGGLLSGSYSPLPGDPRYEPMVARLEVLFAAHQRDGRVVMPYRTQVYFGRLA